ncbi:peptide chain release factor N(5)-glutamine methyltransferase [Marinifilum fragile]|uniref:peptide chain release factor N(5)-glutamine methyltransferase n=1 Tax=Marinifilum fragile TaxID=570161 RepID=UPI002AAC1263|nr:peptide chain release factor N(5)-glutamine methyltransferase [Marinifilum fragile]
MSQLNNIQSTINYIKKELESIYSSRESESIAYILLEELLNYSRTQIQLNKTEAIQDEQFEKIKEYIADLKENKPIQYVLGEADFYELKFKVNQHTLIPRPETEELVHAIINENKDENLHVLDIGTGSGCIPICLAKHLTNANVTSVDISPGAIKTARENAKLNSVLVRFEERDILNWEAYEWEQLDIIVSNPPYVTNAEKEKMEKNVLDFEPHTALFVSDHDPLIFYQRIAELAQEYLKEGGKLYFEINESLGKEMSELMEQKGFYNIQVRKDINGKDRMMSAIK